MTLSQKNQTKQKPNNKSLPYQARGNEPLNEVLVMLSEELRSNLHHPCKAQQDSPANAPMLVGKRPCFKTRMSCDLHMHAMICIYLHSHTEMHTFTIYTHIRRLFSQVSQIVYDNRYFVPHTTQIRKESMCYYEGNALSSTVLLSFHER